MLGAAQTAQLSRWWNRSSLPVGQAVVSNVINYAYQQYSQSSVAYVGPDSSNRPVFFFAYANASNLLRAQLWRINDDGTVTQGAEQSAGAVSVARTVQSMSEYEGANSFGSNTPTNYVYMCYYDNSSLYMVQAALADPDALTCSFGTAVSTTLTPDADQPAVAFVGNSRVVAGGRAVTTSFYRYSRSGTTLTQEGTQSVTSNSQIDDGILGFQNNGSTQYRYGYFNTGNGAVATVIGAGAMGSTNYGVNDSTTITTSSINAGCNLNNTDKMLGVYQISGGVYTRATSITWNAASAPALTVGSELSLGSIVGATGSAWYPVSGFTTDTGYVLYADTASTLSYIPITVSGTTATAGASVQMITGLSNLYYQTSGAPAKIGTKTYLTGVYARSSGAPYIYSYRLS